MGCRGSAATACARGELLIDTAEEDSRAQLRKTWVSHAVTLKTQDSSMRPDTDRTDEKKLVSVPLGWGPLAVATDFIIIIRGSSQAMDNAQHNICTTSVQLNIINPRGGVKTITKTANQGLVVECMDRAQGPI